MRKPKFHKEIISFPVFNYDMYVVVADDFQSVVDYFGFRHRLKEGVVACAVYSDEQNHLYLFFKSDAPATVIGHEAWHAVRAMFERVSADLENEMVAYHLEYLMERIIRVVKNARKK